MQKNQEQPKSTIDKKISQGILDQRKRLYQLKIEGYTDQLLKESIGQKYQENNERLWLQLRQDAGLDNKYNKEKYLEIDKIRKIHVSDTAMEIIKWSPQSETLFNKFNKYKQELEETILQSPLSHAERIQKIHKLLPNNDFTISPPYVYSKILNKMIDNICSKLGDKYISNLEPNLREKFTQAIRAFLEHTMTLILAFEVDVSADNNIITDIDRRVNYTSTMKQLPNYIDEDGNKSVLALWSNYHNNNTELIARLPMLEGENERLKSTIMKFFAKVAQCRNDYIKNVNDQSFINKSLSYTLSILCKAINNNSKLKNVLHRQEIRDEAIGFLANTKSGNKINPDDKSLYMCTVLKRTNHYDKSCYIFFKEDQYEKAVKQINFILPQNQQIHTQELQKEKNPYKGDYTVIDKNEQQISQKFNFQEEFSKKEREMRRLITRHNEIHNIK